MLLVGIDWAEAEHAACLLDVSGTVVRQFRVPHSAAGLRRLRAAIAAVESEPQAVLVALERAHGLLVDALLAAGYTVYALNPKAVERYRSRTRTAGAKSDPADAELLARILLTDRERHRSLRPSSQQAEAIRALARDDERACRDERRLLNRLRQDLLEVFPQALVAFPRLAAVSALAFLARWPTAEAAHQLRSAELEQFLREQQQGWPERTAARIHGASSPRP
jgi:transposase